MNKYTTLMVMFLFLIIVTLVADSVLITTSEDMLGGGIADAEKSSSAIFSMISTYYKIITFQIPSMPFIVNAIVFYPLSFGIVFMIVDILKDLIPFT
ncbi:MAG: hypothetical protein QXI16_01095 [Sulfolobaceae archaeon]